jgi:pimeloyl-ACP methyl ester carboxylesterase
MMNQSKEIRQTVIIPLPNTRLQGDLCIPESAGGLVMFVHGSGSSRHSPRNKYVAEVLNKEGVATLLFDLLTPHEEAIDSSSGELRFNIELLAERVIQTTSWVREFTTTSKFKIGYFGASTGAAAALAAASVLPDDIQAVVSRGGRPDLAMSMLENVKAPTLLIVGGNDVTVLGLNHQAASQLQCEKAIEVIRGAGHLFEEPGTLHAVARTAACWFVDHFANHREYSEHSAGAGIS